MTVNSNKNTQNNSNHQSTKVVVNVQAPKPAAPKRKKRAPSGGDGDGGEPAAPPVDPSNFTMNSPYANRPSVYAPSVSVVAPQGGMPVPPYFVSPHTNLEATVNSMRDAFSQQLADIHNQLAANATSPEELAAVHHATVGLQTSFEHELPTGASVPSGASMSDIQRPRPIYSDRGNDPMSDVGLPHSAAVSHVGSIEHRSVSENGADNNAPPPPGIYASPPPPPSVYASPPPPPSVYAAPPPPPSESAAPPPPPLAGDVPPNDHHSASPNEPDIKKEEHSSGAGPGPNTQRFRQNEMDRHNELIKEAAWRMLQNRGLNIRRPSDSGASALSDAFPPEARNLLDSPRFHNVESRMEGSSGSSHSHASLPAYVRTGPDEAKDTKRARVKRRRNPQPHSSNSGSTQSAF